MATQRSTHHTAPHRTAHPRCFSAPPVTRKRSNPLTTIYVAYRRTQSEPRSAGTTKSTQFKSQKGRQDTPPRHRQLPYSQSVTSGKESTTLPSNKHYTTSHQAENGGRLLTISISISQKGTRDPFGSARSTTASKEGTRTTPHSPAQPRTRKARRSIH